jgi:GntR family transcriptional repressor for pyruvate dehydrogenase complex
VDIVAERLEKSILEGQFSEGDKLPSEEQLAVQLRVGRRSVREALKVLETKGLVEVQKGVGTIVVRNDLESFLWSLTRNVASYLSTDKASTQHVMELRWLIEGAALERLINHPDETRLDRLAEVIARQREAYAAQDARTYQKWHFRYHEEIIDSLGNPVISMIYKQVLYLVRARMEQAGSDLEIMREAIGEHERIVAAVRRQSLPDLRVILSEHLAHFVSHLDQVPVEAFAE